MRVGFTGTQDGMTDAQKETVRNIVLAYVSEFDHGDCVGADADAHDIVADEFGLDPWIHPPSNSYKRAWKKSSRVLAPKPYLERNHDIVDATEALIATPKEFEEQLRSGTWATVRYARKKKRRIWLVLPDGTVAA